MSNDIFYRRPGQLPEGNNSTESVQTPPEIPNIFSRAASGIGIAALISVFTFTIFPAVILGSLSLILALLSRGKELSFNVKAKTAVILSGIALCANIALVGGSFYMVFGDNSYHEELNTTYEEMFGMTYDEILEGIMDGTLDINELYEQMEETIY